MLDHLPDGVVAVDRTGAIIFCNGAAAALLPGGGAGLGSPAQGDLLDARHQPLAGADLLLSRVLAGHQLQGEEFILAGGANRWVAISGGLCPALGSDIALLVLRDISALKQQEANLLGQALYDGLTGLPNRHLFLDRLNHALARVHNQPHPLMALLFINLNRVGAITLGDALLAELGTRLRTQTPAGASLARLEGDTFIVLLEDIQTSTSAIELAEHLYGTIQQPFTQQPQEVCIEASIGIALGPGLYQSAEDWLRDADTAMAQVKHSPGQPWHMFDNALWVQQDQRLRTEIELRQALDRGELRLHYQPIVTISTEDICGFEALVRWQHPSRGLLMPSEFIDIAEATGLIIPLGWWVLQEACRQMQVWTEQYPAMGEFTVSVNMSSKQFSEPHLVEKIQQILSDTGFVAHRLKIEITEGVLIDHSDSIIATLEQLKAMGIKLLVDDFGTGYSSLSYLHRFPFDCLKIDRSFIENADQDFEKLEILQSVVRLAWNLGLDVVAEGVETTRHHAQLKALRCELGQGYLFSRPLAPEAVETMMVEKQATALVPTPLTPAPSPNPAP
jgi:diguanylate cyclase (GGDEF)-like protein